MIFKRGRHTSCDLFLNNTKLEAVDSFKYLGVVFISLKIETGFEHKKG